MSTRTTTPATQASRPFEPFEPHPHAAPPHSVGERLGAQFLPDGSGTRFRVWTTQASQVAVRLGGQNYAMPLSSTGYHETVLPVGPGTRYTFVLDGQATPDPYARFLPEGVHGEAEVVAFYQYEWQCKTWNGLPLEQCVFYELHIGAFTPEGTYAAAQAKLPELKALGITAVELMPLAAFAGQRGWGYDGVALYAPHAPYGRPEELMAFIDAAHALGLAVMLDVVYNHFGPDGNYLRRYSPQYFTDRFHTAWGEGLDYREPHMRRLITENARMWLREYHFDGLRLDATQSMQDDSATHILAEIASEVHRLGGVHLMLAEDYRNLPMLVTEYHLDGIWVDDFHHVMRVTLTGDQDSYYAAFSGGAAALADVITYGWVYQGQEWPMRDTIFPSNKRGESAAALAAPSFVYFIQNHDQIGNRPLGDRSHHLPQVSAAAYRGASTVLLSLPMTPLLFMGQEWSASTPFPFFSDHHGELGRLISEGRKREFGDFKGFDAHALDPQEHSTFERAKLNWPEREQGEHAKTWQLYRDLLALRQRDPVLSQRSRRGLHALAHQDVLCVTLHSGDVQRLLLWNTGQQAAALSDLPPCAGFGEVLFSSEGRTHLTALAPGEAAIMWQR